MQGKDTFAWLNGQIHFSSSFPLAGHTHTTADLPKTSTFPVHQTTFSHKLTCGLHPSALLMTCILLNEMFCVVLSSCLTSQQCPATHSIPCGTLPSLSCYFLSCHPHFPSTWLTSHFPISFFFPTPNLRSVQLLRVVAGFCIFCQ